MFRRAISSAGKVLVGVGSVQLGAAAISAPLTDKQLGKKPEWYKNDVLALEAAIKNLSTYRYIENEEILNNAEEVFKHYVDSNNPNILWRLARTLTEKASLIKDPSKKKELLTEALHLAEKAVALEGKAGIAQAHKWYALAASNLAKVDKKASKCPKLKESILNHLKRAVELDPKDAYAVHLLGVAQYNNKDYKSAIDNFKKAESIKSGFSAANLFYLGDSQRLSGDKAGAIETLKRAFQTASKNQFDTKGRAEAKNLLLNKLKQKLEDIEIKDDGH